MSGAGEGGWHRGKLGNLLPLKYGKGLPEKSRDSSGFVPVFGSSGQVGQHNQPLTGGPTLIVGRKGTVGAVHLSPEPCWPIDTVYFAEAEEGQNLKYYKYLLDSLNLARLDRSTAIPGLSRDDYNAVEVTIAPPREQERIVAEIEKQFSRLDEAVANLKRVKANLKRYKAAVLKAAVEGRIVPTEAVLARQDDRSYEDGSSLLERIQRERRSDWNGKASYREPVAPIDGWMRNLPKGWTVASLEALTSANRVICYGILMPKENVKDGVLFVKVRDMKDDTIDLESLHRTSYAIAAKYARASLRAGDLLLSIRGTYGRVAAVPSVLDGGNITQDTARLDVNPNMSSDFIALYLRSEAAQTYFKAVARGVAVKGVNIGDIRPMPVPVPPASEQNRIANEVARRLSILREIDNEVQRNLARADSLREKTLTAAFASGGLHAAKERNE